MVRISMALAVLGLVLVLASFAPWVAGARPAPAVAPVADATIGQQLFAAKGCAQCHVHAAVPGSGKFGRAFVEPAPDLTNRPGDPAYQRAWLREPQAVKPTTAMPNLGLSEAEIADLVAFLQAGAVAR